MTRTFEHGTDHSDEEKKRRKELKENKGTSTEQHPSFTTSVQPKKCTQIGQEPSEEGRKARWSLTSMVKGCVEGESGIDMSRDCTTLSSVGSPAHAELLNSWITSHDAQEGSQHACVST